jgi:inhibitor of KinA
MNYKIYPISDSALTIDFGNEISEELNDIVMSLFEAINVHNFEGFVEAIPAYSTLSVFYKVSKSTNFRSVSIFLESLVQTADYQQVTNRNLIHIPVIYDGEDLEFVAKFHQLSVEEVIQIHTSATYRIYMMGFLPGFAYMGGTDERIATPRRDSPRLKVPAGSVGIGGKQTGIYPLESPGGWQLIGRTNLKLFDPCAMLPTLLQAGDLVKFIVA